MLREIHFLLTYNCNFGCAHCFLFCGPSATGTFTIAELRKVFAQIAEVDSIGKVYFEGGEAFLYYPLMLEGVRLARNAGLGTGIVTNSFWATTIEDAEIWLRPLVELGISDLSVSDDSYHHGDLENSPAKRALTAARNLGLTADSICVDEPTVELGAGGEKGEAIVGGGVRFRGRAAEKLTGGLPRQAPVEFRECPYEELDDPMRVHVDPYGNVHLCQGLLMGNLWKTPLAELVARHTKTAHPICAPLVRGGPAELARELAISPDEGYVDPCHFCFSLRKEALERFPDHLGPRQVYGLGGSSIA